MYARCAQGTKKMKETVSAKKKREDFYVAMNEEKRNGMVKSCEQSEK